MLRTLRVLLRKEFLQIRRDPVILRMLLIMPVLQLLILSNAATFEVKRARLWVVDQDATPASRAVVDRLTGGDRFVAVAHSTTFVPAEQALLDGAADVVIVVPNGFDRDLARDRKGSVQLALNAENGAEAGVIQGYASQILASYALEAGVQLTPQMQYALARHEQPPKRGQAVVEVRRRSWYNASLNYQHYMVPGILLQLITIVGTLMTALNIVREKEAGTLDQLNVTPISRAAFIAAKLIPLWTIALVVLTMGLIIAHFVFGVPVVGNVALVYLGAGIYLLAALGIGLWISTVADTQQQALFVTFALMMIYTLMSGLFTPVHGMPAWVQSVAQFNPLLHCISLTRAVLLKGATLADVSHQLMVLAVAGATILTIAVLQYRKRAS